MLSAEKPIPTTTQLNKVCLQKKKSRIMRHLPIHLLPPSPYPK